MRNGLETHEDRRPWGVTGAHGALKGMFNISARLNGAHIVLGLLYGKDDFDKSIEIATRAGQDSDCNPSTVGVVLGTKLGFAKLPAPVRTAIAPYMNVKFSNTAHTIETASQECLALAVANVKANGGKESGDRMEVDFPGTAVWLGCPERCRSEAILPKRIVVPSLPGSYWVGPDGRTSSSHRAPGSGSYA